MGNSFIQIQQSYTGLMIIRTERLTLAPVEPSDAHVLLSGERQSDWTADYPTEGDLVIARLIADNPVVPVAGTKQYVPYKIILNASGQVIGGCGFLGPPDATGSVEIGYGLVPSQRGKGIATEAVDGLIAEAWRDTAVEVVFALTDQDNEPSQGVLRRLGFQQVASEGEETRWEIVPSVNRRPR